MPVLSPAAVRQQLTQGRPDPIYLIVGDDDAEMTRLAGEMTSLVDEPLRAFNCERFHAGERGASPAAIVEAARLVPMMSDRRVVVVLRAERLLKPRRRAKPDAEPDDAEDIEPASDMDLLEAYIRQPVAETTLVFVATDVDRSRRIYKALQKHATIVECWGLRPGRDARVDLRQVARMAEQMVREAVAAAGQRIEGPAARLVAERAGADIATLRADVDRLLLYSAGSRVITLDDARQVVSGETSLDDWAVTSAIQRRDAREALRQLALALDGGGVPYMILGQLAWFVREKMAMVDPGRVPAAIDAVFRTDLDLKSSGGDPRVLLERLVVELCRG
jgi:DNA polymerase III delta subunit